MKKKKNLGPLSLNKKSISKLNMDEVKGGGPILLSVPCSGPCTTSILDITRGNCDVPTIGHDDGSWCISKNPDAWCGGR